MKIGILTFHFAHNYGAMLQAYALTTKLNEMGYKAELVDYRLPEIYQYHEKLNFINLFKRYRKKNTFVLSLLKTIKNYNKHRNKDAKWDRFNEFLESELTKSKRIYSPNLSVLNYDAFICGSDQIWNYKLTGRLEPIYFAATARQEVKRISYAASNGSGIVEDKILKEFMHLIANLNQISVREENLAYFLSDKITTPLYTVMDPVFLLGSADWNRIAINPVVKDYILTYSFHENELFFKALNTIAEREQKKVIRLCFQKNDQLANDIIQIDNIGPKEFLGYFANASLVVTNSFHGTAFSILYQKQFYSVPPQKYRDRIDALLGGVNLQNRIINKLEDIDSIKESINYDYVNQPLRVLRNKSMSFLENALSE